MRIGIDGSRAFIQQRTGIEEYAYQCIKRLRGKLNNCQVILYIRPKPNFKIDFDLPDNWKVKVIKFPYFWTQVGLSLEMLLHPVDILFVPAHTLPIIHPKNSVVVIHGLEYEFCPKAYAWKDKFYMRWVIKKSCQWANKIISVSENTKQDLIKLYKIPPKKIEVIYEGVPDNFQFPCLPDRQAISKLQKDSKFQIPNSKFLLFIGRLEKRKNIIGIIEAFEILKEKYNLSHKLVLAGKKGYKYENIKTQISKSKYKKDIIEMGYVSDKNKRALLKRASVFLFPSFYEGFGLPILEAQSLGVPVITSNNSSMREITSDNFQLNFDDQTFNRKKEVQSSALLINPHNSEEIAKVTWKLINDKNLRNDIIKKRYKNVKRFSWEKCADQLAQNLFLTPP